MIWARYIGMLRLLLQRKSFPQVLSGWFHVVLMRASSEVICRRQEAGLSRRTVPCSQVSLDDTPNVLTERQLHVSFRRVGSQVHGQDISIGFLPQVPERG